MSVLVVMEQSGGMSLETLAAGQQLAKELGTTASAALLGSGGAAAPAAELEKVYSVEHELLGQYTPDGYASALKQLVAQVKPTYVLFPHTYQVRDFLPKLATSLGKVAVSDVIHHRVENGAVILVRQLFQGKISADVRFAGEPPHFASLQAGAYRADRLTAGSPAVEKFTPVLNAGEIRTKPHERFRESARAVDLGAADLIVAVGRGIKEADNIPLVQQLAGAMGAQMAASPPICDAGWLPMERQVGSSGQTVGPKMYMAVGISGAIQHLVGMKGSRVIVAINKDPNAPIFEVADYGIVGDLFQVVPELIEEFKKAK